MIWKREGKRIHCVVKENLNSFKSEETGATLCVAVQSHRGDLFELIPIPLEPRGQLEGKDGKGESGWGGGWIFLCNLPERFKNPGDPAIYLALCYAEPRQRKIDGVTASNPSPLFVSFSLPCRLSWFPRLSGHPNPVQTPATTPSPSQWGTTAVAILDGELLNEKDE